MQRDGFDEHSPHTQTSTVPSQTTAPTYEYPQHQGLHSPYHHANGCFLQPRSPGYLMAQGSPLPPTLVHSPVMFKQEQYSPMQASLMSVHPQQNHTAVPNGMQHSPKMASLSPYSQSQPSPQVCYSNCTSPMQLQVQVGGGHHQQQPAAATVGDLNQQYMHTIHAMSQSQGLTIHTHHPNHPPPQYKEPLQPKLVAVPYPGLQPQYAHSTAGFQYACNPVAAASLGQDYSLTHMSAAPNMVYQPTSPGMPLR